ncbi:ferritin-3, chloroplastic-like [Raphanus sativus]|uniref:Ferritin-3, chloroplastic n=1 Tax=Raphanus sativus TaxID=3726 RepID=A0A6J0KCT9_RAPSA|nr:ferritin-3, chloroplastic [Raphanus sativus]XP_018475472.1 ferritin-3, chloroplastic-like [Raphanus sativus]XP_018475473.1 PREDICTED: ferritin-3, chloroplastic-like [Raphanus sativus]
MQRREHVIIIKGGACYMMRQNIRGGRVKLEPMVMPQFEFDHAEKGDDLYGQDRVKEWSIGSFLVSRSGGSLVVFCLVVL